MVYLTWLQYIFIIIHHKFIILLTSIWVNWTLRGTGLRISAYRILVHDFSKFSSSELPGYAYNFCGEGKGKPRSEIFARAWKHHYLSNDHHHQYWMDYKTGKYKPMAVEAVCELVADWLAASISYAGIWPSPGRFPWLEREFKKVSAEMHPATALFLQGLLVHFRFEAEIMKSVHGEDFSGQKFDWYAASSQLDTMVEAKETASKFASIMHANRVHAKI